MYHLRHVVEIKDIWYFTRVFSFKWLLLNRKYLNGTSNYHLSHALDCICFINFIGGAL